MDRAVLLKQLLNQVYDQYHRREFLQSDPLEFPHRFQRPREQEAVAVLSALLAYGNVKQIRRSVQDALDRMAPWGGPEEWILTLSREKNSDGAARAMRGFVHRFNTGSDLVTLFKLIGRSWREFGSVGEHFLSFHRSDAATVEPALNALIRKWREWAHSEFHVSRSGNFDYLLTAPEDGSCCKRWCMLLRWMGRSNDELDLGLWAPGLRASQLLLPLDTHTGRISQYIGLTRRRTLNWRAVLEVTDSLRSLCSEDPTRYDFALARLGILDLCQMKYRPEICSQCSLNPICLWSQAAQKAHIQDE